MGELERGARVLLDDEVRGGETVLIMDRGRPVARLGLAAARVSYTGASARCCMASHLPVPPPGFDELSVAEKLEYVQSLWDLIAASPQDVPVPDWHREVINQRMATRETDPTAGEPWDAVRDALVEKLGGAPRRP